MDGQFGFIPVDLANLARITLSAREPVEKSQVKAVLEGGLYVFPCPHCSLLVEVEQHQVNCAIFRHACYFTRTPTGQIILTEQLNPHAPREVCERLVAEGKVYGCGKPFRMIPTPSGYEVECCDYI